MTKQEISTFMQDVNKNNQEVRDSFCQSELTNAQKFAELDREVAELKKKISRVANNTSKQPNNQGCDLYAFAYFSLLTKTSCINKLYMF
jgi:inorganic triphosphatase YgiF